MSELSSAFGQLVRKYRKEKNISQEKLALLCNIDRSYMGRIERGEVNITLEKLYELANALGVPVISLLPKISLNK
ncbi:helix-turn-helix transcriptional regulator [Acinetobacter nosocomialis]|uniref:helix-turn-helix domain-containing protein n=1 Tax=Acinetobacter TaxID=469 RepID=UPI00294068CE|nr:MULTISPECIES: helix-turn-helix transcriptional regulator [Acinetobacter]MDV4273935.1 helix-turn-helix domain-containing protein [Acinetobacter baumannii]MEB3795758.1 helix-turn-helix domain-containing protein [Acinetobacter sp. IK24]MEB3814907.1 helix-turn-helix domain-containing protein [Acinetobacter sp. IK22]MEB3834148.1 helix-turn-helix domain-containing protein [Acinetobacter sp. IK23]